jgi:hypothetical protein
MNTDYLYLAGSMPFLLLGLLHTVFTLSDCYSPTRLVPYNAGVMGLMKESSLALSKHSNMWRAWVGFNISHGVGMLFFAITYAYLSLCHGSALDNSLFFTWAAPGVALIYLILARKYWFSLPAIGSGLGLLCFVAGAMLQL